MRQPVAGVLSLAAAALAVPRLPHAARSWLQQIVCEAESLSELIERSLHAGDAPEDSSLTDLAEVASEAVTGEQLTYPGGLEVSTPGATVVAEVNRVDARRIIANLLSNATRAAGPDGCVTVAVTRDQDCAQLVVEDSGPGFAQIPPSTGLGVAVITRCLSSCGGQLDFAGSRAGGVKATVSLPLAGCARSQVPQAGTDAPLPSTSRMVSQTRAT
jgi:signal transduction histidine kinase